MRFFFLLFLIFTIVSSLAELEVDGDDLVLKMDSNDEIKVRRARSEDAVKGYEEPKNQARFRVDV
ncbi:hypothetical protein PRIPAC_71974 [Pristionchus pacificus]|uniref:Uncharacterized protein n=1 Tax=Pristionchus pacificus TaxID=54126 RepID=A0A454Y758_PRIPA|nr:hypothetical protein PRIPAC_71974 [Pristionchus pacificus]|eukprot:PDM74956.1 hypothetical protein PRIPAC_40337 [Pristionchus pacificus]